MNNGKITFVEPWITEWHTEPLVTETLAPHEVLVRKRYTLISPGTELACLSGGEAWFPLPGVHGYSAVSEVIEAGSASEFAAGDIVFHYGKHMLYEKADAAQILLKVPGDLDLKLVPFVRMANVAMTAIRQSAIELGDWVAVTGQGLVGNMAAQLAKLQGASVIGIDLSDKRLEIAERCGVSYALHSGRDDAGGRIAEITGGQGVSTLIEATGVPQVIESALPWIGRFGEIILLGSPRGEYRTNLTDIMNYCHLANLGNIQFKGAHEWRYPLLPDPFVKHSIARNCLNVFELIRQNRLSIEPLISHILAPQEAQSAYDGLRFKKDEYYGVLFDWS